MKININPTKGSKIRIDFIDNGKGIDSEIMEFITDLYFTDKDLGSGIGLAITKWSIQRHNGILKYSSKKKRTVFTVILPRFTNNVTISND